MERQTTLVGGPNNSVMPCLFFGQYPFVGRFLPLIGMICLLVECFLIMEKQSIIVSRQINFSRQSIFSSVLTCQYVFSVSSSQFVSPWNRPFAHQRDQLPVGGMQYIPKWSKRIEEKKNVTPIHMDVACY